MKKKIDSKDEEEQKVVDKEVEEKKAISNFKKILPFNRPFTLVIIGCLFSAINGLPNPLTGLILSKLFAVFPVPFAYLATADMSGKEFFKQEVSKYCGYLGLIALTALAAATIVKVCFGFLGENVTFEIR
jgi:hypothetical protein